jgi:hypothetical protein
MDLLTRAIIAEGPCQVCYLVAPSNRRLERTRRMISGVKDFTFTPPRSGAVR